MVHPQSIVHSMVEFTDGSTIAQLSLPDMRLPIGYALAWPDRLATPFGRIDWTALRPARLRAARPRRVPVPGPGLRRRPGRRDWPRPCSTPPTRWPWPRSSPGAIPWMAIPEVLDAVLARHDGARADGVEAVIEADRRGREAATQEIERITR